MFTLHYKKTQQQINIPSCSQTTAAVLQSSFLLRIEPTFPWITDTLIYNQHAYLINTRKTSKMIWEQLDDKPWQCWGSGRRTEASLWLSDHLPGSLWNSSAVQILGSKPGFPASQEESAKREASVSITAMLCVGLANNKWLCFSSLQLW